MSYSLCPSFAYNGASMHYVHLMQMDSKGEQLATPNLRSLGIPKFPTNSPPDSDRASMSR